MVGCRHNARNTLVKNYLDFAETLGVTIQPGRQLTEVRPELHLPDEARPARVDPPPAVESA